MTDIVERLSSIPIGADYATGEEFFRPGCGSQAGVDAVREAAAEIERLRRELEEAHEAMSQAIGSLKALGAEDGYAAEALRKALNIGKE